VAKRRLLLAAAYWKGVAQAAQQYFAGKLSDLVRLKMPLILPLDRFHLVLEAQFQLLESNLFEFFVVGEKSLFNQGIES
jgi:hypothetical protein